MSDKSKKLIIDCKDPVKDGVMNCGQFELYLKEHVESGQTGYFGKDVSFEKTWENDKVVLKGELSMRYMKFLTKNYLNEEKDSYELDYSEINNEIKIIRSLGTQFYFTFFSQFYVLKPQHLIIWCQGELTIAGECLLLFML